MIAIKRKQLSTREANVIFLLSICQDLKNCMLKELDWSKKPRADQRKHMKVPAIYKHKRKHINRNRTTFSNPLCFVNELHRIILANLIAL